MLLAGIPGRAADQAAAFPQLEMPIGSAFPGVALRLVVGVGRDPVGTDDLAGAVQPVQPITWQTRNPPFQSLLSSWLGGGIHLSYTRIGLLTEKMNFFWNVPVV